MKYYTDVQRNRSNSAMLSTNNTVEKEEKSRKGERQDPLKVEEDKTLQFSGKPRE